MPRQMYVPLFLLLLLFVQLCSTSGILAEESTEVVRELPVKGENASQAYTVYTKGRKLIRIRTSTRDLQNTKKYCSKEGMSIWDFEGNPIKCHNYNVLKTEDMQYLKNDVLPAAVKLHADRLLVDRVNGSLVVPEFEEDSLCSYFTVPPSHHCKGVNNTDMVLYVAAKPVTPFATICARDESRRPIAAGVNLAFYRKYGLRYNVRITAHEIAHALGFNYEDMVNASMVSNITDVRGKNRVTRALVTSNKTLEKARKHYGCDTLNGMELADDTNDKNVVSPHWAHRIAKDELMSSYTVFGAGYYTALTMAFFEDLKYYTANWGMEEPMTWGNDSGCEFINDACTNEMKRKYNNMFCDTESPRCTSDRFAVGRCTSFTGYRVYTEPDECPFAKPEHVYTSNGMLSALCTLTVNNTIPGSVTGNDSWCLDGDSLKVNDVAGRKNNVSVGGVCARVKCEGNGVLKVMYAGNDTWHDCSEGHSLEPSTTSSSFVSGKIKCPKYSEVCTMAPNGSSLLRHIVPYPISPEEAESATESLQTSNEERTGSSQPPRDVPRETEGEMPSLIDDVNSHSVSNGDVTAASTGVDDSPLGSVPSPSTPTASTTVPVLLEEKTLGVRHPVDGVSALSGFVHVAFLLMALAAAVPL